MEEKETLEVFLHGAPVGVLTKGKKVGAATFTYYEGVSNPISVSLPLSDQTFDATRTRNWFGNLLPEGEFLDSLNSHFVVLPKDYVELLRETGRECAGAITFEYPSGTPRYTVGNADPEAIVSALPSIAPEAGSDSLRSLVAGYQPKIPLLLTSNGWAIPTDGLLTTHIAKPEPERYRGLADAEAWAMALASGVAKAAPTEVIEFGGVRTLISERFDRYEVDGRVMPLHQEDLNQALGLPVEHKYAEVLGNKKTTPSLAKAARILTEHAADPTGELRELARHMTVNVVLRNTDWHAKNVSFLYDASHLISLAPMYDVIPTTHFLKDANHMSLTVNNKFRLDRIFFLDLIEEAKSWGMDEDDAEAVIRETVDGMASGISEAETRFPKRPEGLVEDLKSRLLRFGADTYGGV